jgi:hypothetical protein
MSMSGELPFMHAAAPVVLGSLPPFAASARDVYAEGPLLHWLV